MKDCSQVRDCTRFDLGVQSDVPERNHAELVLELSSVLELISDRCRTEIGAEFARGMSPTSDRDLAKLRLAQTEDARRLLLISEPPTYGSIRNVSTQVEICGKGGTASAEDLFRIAESLGGMARLRKYFSGSKEIAQTLWILADNLPYLDSLAELLMNSFGSEGEVLDGASPELKRIRSEKNVHSRRLVTRIQNLVNGSLRTYLQEPIFTVRGGRYVLPVKAQYKGKVPGILHDASATGQTVFIEPESVVADANKLREYEAAEKGEVEKILRNLSSRVGASSNDIIRGLNSVAEIDAILAKGRYALDRNCATPTVTDGNFIEIRDGHHPLLDPTISVPVSVSVGSHSLLITGPNTGGKTVTLKILGLYSMMMGCGIFPPANGIKYGFFANVFADIGDEQSLTQSLSTFSGHLKNIAAIFRKVKSGDLVLFDEIGAGTDPAEGAALGKAVLTALAEKGAVIAASTHYGEIKAFAQDNEKFNCAAMEFDLNTLKPTYRLIPGASGQSHAFEIAKRYGITSDVVSLAESLLGDEAKSSREMSARLDKYLRDAKKDRDAAAELRASIEEQRKKSAAQQERDEQRIRDLRSNLEKEIENAIRDSRQKYQELLELFKKGANRESIIEGAKQVEAQLVAKRKRVTPKLTGEKPGKLEIGMEVQILKNGQRGTIVDLPKSGKVIVQAGIMKITADSSDIRLVKETKPPAKSIRKQNISLEKTQTISPELHLRHSNFEDAANLLDKFFDDAVLAGLPRLRIVHGKGGGVLRKLVHDFLRKRKEVSNYREADPAEGGAGVTIVVMK